MILRILLRILLGLLLGLAAAEGIARIYLEVIPPTHVSYLRDPDAGYKLRPQSAEEDTTDYHVNSLGFRDREPGPAPTPGIRRIVGIGDSFVFGEVKLRDNFLRRAEALLNEPVPASARGTKPGRTEMVLMGLGGYSPENYLGVLRSTGLAVQPDLVLLCFFVGNDITGIPTRNEVIHGELYGVSSANTILNLLRKSRLFVYAERVAFFRLRRARLRAAIPGTAGTMETAPTTEELQPAPPMTHRFIAGFYNLVQKNRLPVFQRRPSQKLESYWRQAEAYLADFDRTCRSAAVPWVLIVIPDEVQVDPQVRRELLKRLSLSEADYDFAAPERRLKDFATRHRVPVLDLLPILAADHRPDARLYLPNDTHWSVRGNQIAGEAVAKFIQAGDHR